MIFSVFGDDFVMLESESCNVQYLQTRVAKVLQGSGLGFSIQEINLDEHALSCADELERL